MKYILLLIFTVVFSACSFESPEEGLVGDEFFSGNKPSENLLTLTPPENKIYIENEKIQFKVTHPAVLDVTGNPRLPLDVNGSSAFADYISGSGSTELIFEYTVPAGIEDTDGIELTGDLDLNGAVINFDKNGTPELIQANLDPVVFPNVLIDSIIPNITLVAPTAIPNTTILVNQNIDMLITFSESIFVTGAPTLSIDINGTTKELALVSGNGTANLIFRASVDVSDQDLTGYEFISLNLNGATISDNATNTADLSAATTFNTFVYINGDQPYVEQVIPPTNGTYKPGEVISFSLKFTEAVNVTGIPRVALDLDSGSVLANYISGSGSDTLVFNYITLSGNEDSDGIEIGTSIDLNSGTIRDVSNINTILDLVPPFTPNVLVDGTLPRVVSITPPLDGFYGLGTEIFFTLTFNDIVNITGTPRLGILLNSSAPAPVYAEYSSGSGTTNIIMRYVVTSSDVDLDGISLESAIDLNGGLIQNDNLTNANTSITSPASALDLTNIIVNGADTTPPTITAITPPIDKNYITGETIEFRVTFDESVVIENDPILELDIGTVVNPTYVSGSGSSNIIFSYTVVAADKAFNGINLNSTEIDLNGSGVIRDPAFNNAVLDFSAFLPLDLSNITINKSPVTITGVTPPIDKTYIEGEVMNLSFNFSGAVSITATPQVEVDIGGTSQFFDYASGAGTNTLHFTYTVADALEDTDGVTLTSPINLTSGTIIDGSSLFIDPIFTIPNTANVLVDSIDPLLTLNPVANITAANVNSFELSGTCSEETNPINITLGALTNTATCTTGLWSVTAWDVSAEADDPALALVIEHSDNATNTTTINTTVIKDIIAPTVTLVTPANLSFINAGNNSAVFDVDGTCDENTAVVNIQISGVNAASQVGFVCDGTNFSGTIDTTGLASGTYNITAIIRDLAGNETISTANSVTKDAVAPEIEITSPIDAAFINISNNSVTYPITGTCNDNGLTAVIKINGANATSPVGFLCDGTNFSGTIDSTVIADGPVTIQAELTDGGGNTATSTLLNLTKDTIAPVLSMTTPADGSGIDGLSDSATFVVNGTCDENGVTVDIQIDGTSAASQIGFVCDGTNYSGTIDTTGLASNTYAFTAVATDAAGNEGVSTANSITKDLVPPIIEITTPSDNSFINAGTDSATFTITGTCNESGFIVDILIDGVSAASQSGFNCDGTNFTGTIDTTSLAEASFVLTAQLTDGGGNTGTSSNINITKDTIIPTLTLNAAADITVANANPYGVSGTCSDNTGAIDITLGAASVSGTCVGGSYSIDLNSTSAADGTGLTLSVTHTDAAGNESAVATDTLDKDATAPTTLITFSPDIVSGNVSNYSLIGSCDENGTVVNVSIGALSFTPICSSNSWSTGVQDLTALPDGLVAITASQTDAVGNTGSDSGSVMKSIASALVSITNAPDIDSSNEDAYIVSGNCSESGIVVSLNIGGISRTANCAGSTFTIAPTDVSSLTDGVVTITADHDTATQDSVNINKDTVSSTVTIASAPDINSSNEAAYTTSGTCSQAGISVFLDIGGLTYTLNCSISNSWSTGVIDVSSLSDGAITISADHSTATTATVTINKATGTPTVSFFSVSTTLSNSANLNWELSTPGGFTIDDYEINFRIKGSTTWLPFSDGVSTNTFAEVTGLVASTIYEFRARVLYDSGSMSEWSEIAEGETQPEDTIFGPYSAMNVGGANSTTVAAYQDGTNITLNGAPLVTLNRGQTHIFASSQFDVIDADKPIFTAGERNQGSGAGGNANIAWNPTEWAGKLFSFNATRSNPQKLNVYAIEDTVITVKQGTTVLDSATITKGNGAVLQWSVYGSYQVEATGNVLAYHYSGDGGTIHDAKPLIPGFTQILGFPSNSMRLTTFSNSTNYNLIHSNSVTASGSFNKDTDITVNPQGTGALYQGDSLLITADKQISGSSFADSNGLAAGAFVSTNLMKTKYIIPTGGDYIAFASKLAGTIQVRNAADVLVTTLTLSRSGGNANAPYRVRLANPAAGYRFIATVPVGAWYQPNNDVGAADQDETLMYGTNE